MEHHIGSQIRFWIGIQTRKLKFHNCKNARRAGMLDGITVLTVTDDCTVSVRC